ncbi:uncharacterized protein [Lepeophtheirus salmonis]|uniref:uncharacterized protein n=1 Tax=Lepeophtheirus salmonis TaxID=72036 RepID=UPI003AF3E5E2
MVQYNSRFIQNLAKHTGSLYQLLHVNTKFEWDSLQQRAFDEIQSNLAGCTLLVFRQDKTTENSLNGMSSSLEQWRGKIWVPLAVWSRYLVSTQRKYSAFDRRLLAVKEAFFSLSVGIGGSAVHGVLGP